MKFGKILCLLAGLCLAIALAACGDRSENRASNNGHDHSVEHDHDEHDHDEHDHDGHDHDEHDHDGHDHDEHDHDGHDHDGHDHNGHDHEDHDHGETRYTCPMHPQIDRDSPGSCPICGMDLVPRDDDGDEPEISLSGGLQQAMNVRTTRVERDRLWRRIDTFGEVAFDESHLAHIHARVQGWIGEIEVSALGDRVEEGELLFTLYSSDLVNAQEEFLQAMRSGDSGLQQAARERLEVLDVQDRVIDQLESDGQVKRYLPWYARRDGVVTALDARAGMYVEPGVEMMEFADPRHLWVIARVFDSRMDWLDDGQSAEIRTPALPDETLEAEVTYVEPELDPDTRTARARLELTNPDGRLRPGNWTSVAIFGGPTDDTLVIPREALIRTGQGERVVVREDTRFTARDVHVGITSGDYVEILHGLEEEEEVVVSGQFLIDSEAAMRSGHDRMGGGHDH